MNSPFKIIAAQSRKVPIIVSIPHCGRAFPNELKEHYNKELAANPDDTDFFVDKLYDFSSNLGITTIKANYSRWVIDLNRSPENRALYNDGRIITQLTPTTDFLGNAIYKSANVEPNKKEITRRRKIYYQPYYDQISQMLTEIKKTFGIAILWDAHSIRRSVPTIQREPFPDMILGTNDGKTADKNLIISVQSGLKNSPFQLSNNEPFKGGNITRHFGNPSQNIHAFQLEMTKDLYMDDTETKYHPKRAKIIRTVLINTFKSLIDSIAYSKK